MKANLTKEYSIIKANINEDIETMNNSSIVFKSINKLDVMNHLLSINANDDDYVVEIYKVDEEGEFIEGSDYDTPSNFIKNITKR